MSEQWQQPRVLKYNRGVEDNDVIEFTNRQGERVRILIPKDIESDTYGLNLVTRGHYE